MLASVALLAALLAPSYGTVAAEGMTTLAAAGCGPGKYPNNRGICSVDGPFGPQVYGSGLGHRRVCTVRNGTYGFVRSCRNY